jgi:hypothetical protein
VLWAAASTERSLFQPKYSVLRQESGLLPPKFSQDQVVARVVLARRVRTACVVGVFDF